MKVEAAINYIFLLDPPSAAKEESKQIVEQPRLDRQSYNMEELSEKFAELFKSIDNVA